ncbi:IclR family transcriptional regulator [Halorubellus sp. JP-L1]|uniref:IclR family transcriptional regulator n=1 Tax=Halorubellus sp. JP-L1 TaxID=2715753 RepID=UPI00140B6ABE|nr:IclR family transcriptional regulator [Halorubellus sp. JP-L1]NHN42807.1 IclR family transcriptional regulator [Halorubellus sp. JP-L1]
MGIKSTQTLIGISEVLKDHEEGLGVTALADELGMAKSTIHNHLSTLEEHGFVVNDDGTYRLGLRFLDFGMATRNSSRVYQVAKPKVDELSASIEQKVWCMVEQQGRGVRLYVSDYNDKLQTNAYIGQRTYLHQSAAGKAILAHLPERRVDEIIERVGLPEATSETITERDELFEELSEIRDRGVAFNQGESVWGLTGVGAPIRDKDGNVLGSVSVAAASNIMKDSRLRSELSEQLLGTINEIEINLTHN